MFDEIVLSVVSFAGGCFVRYLFDSRDYRQKILEGDFFMFTKECARIRDDYILYCQELHNHNKQEEVAAYSKLSRTTIKELGENLKNSLNIIEEFSAAKSVYRIVNKLNKVILEANIYYDKRFDEEGNFKKEFLDFLEDAKLLQDELIKDWIDLNRRLYFVLTSVFKWDVQRIIRNKFCSTFANNGS
ncbi:hypothetical protein [Solidesulfovibrio sp. C21]|uniref:hypothetical protein n=1 Tax=Solidesulfovibrio sp. C21 TaxID=3398613 RepID=UPI0039FBFCA2